MHNSIKSTKENYLETIYVLSSEEGHAHVKDIAEKMSIKKPSVSQALLKLKAEDLIHFERYGFIILTSKGRTLARNVQKRHSILYSFFNGVLGLDEKTSQVDACKIEHFISKKTLNKIEQVSRQRHLL